jgi:hypothetical protein
MQHLLAARALDECPCVVELGLSSYMPSCSLRFILIAEHAQFLGRERCLCVHNVWQ